MNYLLNKFYRKSLLHLVNTEKAHDVYSFCRVMSLWYKGDGGDYKFTYIQLKIVHLAEGRVFLSNISIDLTDGTRFYAGTVEKYIDTQGVHISCFVLNTKDYGKVWAALK